MAATQITGRLIKDTTIDTADIADKAVTLAKQADMATASVIYRKTAAAGVPEVQTLATLKTDLGLTGTNSGDNTLAAGIATFLGTPTSANLIVAVTDETGTGALVFGTGPSIDFGTS